MSQRSRSSRVRQHVHCDSCYSRRCRARVEASVCCALVPCRLLCGAVFHLCKEEDHLLLCPNVRVPCINAAFGCPLQMCRSSRAQHLRTCPASVVSCSMEWLRWPTDDTNPHSFKALQENVLKENKGEEEALDLALALVDQANLYTRLKMKPLYPELMDPDEVEEETKEEKKEEAAVEIVDDSIPTIPQNHGVYGNAVTQEIVKMDAKQSLAHIKEKCSLTEMMFGMDRGGCEQACKQDGAKPNARAGAGRTDSKDEERPGGREDAGTGEAASGNAPPPDTTKCGHAPWQEGVLERLGQDLTPQEYNMYVVHHGRMLIAFGQIEACTPREKDFVYGSLEPIPVQTLRSFKVPDSYHYRRRVHLYDTASRAQSETRSVDTSDLNVEEEDCFSDEAASTLLGYAEIEVMGHRISESKAADGLYIDVGTQTHSFRAAPFKAKTTLAEVMTDRPLKLHLQLQAESVSGRHNRNSCAFSFVCGQAFHRKEFATHVRNVHSDIQTCLSGWFEQRCPLSYLGCTYTQRRFRPSTQDATVTYNQQLRCFNLRPVTEPSSGGDSATGGGAAEEDDSLSSLPYEVLCHMAGFLDSLSLSQLALVSRLMRQVCSTQLQERGMVTLQWERKTYSHGGVKWRAKPVWEFSHLFSSVDSWRMSNTPPISAHLKVCPFYQASPIGQPVPLLNLTQKEGCSKETPTLVNHFKQMTAMKQSH